MSLVPARLHAASNTFATDQCDIGNTRPSIDRGNERSISTARLLSGTWRELPFLVIGRYAIRLTNSTFFHCNDRISPRRIAVSNANTTAHCTQGVRGSLLKRPSALRNGPGVSADRSPNSSSSLSIRSLWGGAEGSRTPSTGFAMLKPTRGARAL